MMSGALLLSVASLFAKILSAVYRVPFQNMVGNTGFYVYQQVYPIYGIGMTFALSGFPVFFSKTIAEAKNRAEHRLLIKQSLLILSVFSVGLFGILYLFSKQIAQYMGDEQLTPILQSVSWMFLFMPVLATFRGYFQGTYRMKPTAISQVMEQIIRVVVILLVAYLFTVGGTDLYQMGAAAMSGATWGAIGSTIILFYAILKERREHPFETDIFVSKERHSERLSELAKRYLTEGMTICLLTSILVLFQLIDSFTLYKGLVENGMMEEAAKSLKGIYDRGQPLVQLGMVVGTGFSASFIPMMTQAFVAEQSDRFHYAAKSLIRMTATFSIAAAVGLLAILPEVNHMLFGDRNGNSVLAVYILSIVAASLVMAYHSILQSENQYRITLYALGIGLLIKYTANIFLVSHYGTMGASVSTLLGLIVMTLFLGSKMRLSLKRVWKTDHFLAKLCGGSVLLYCGVYLSKFLLGWYFVDVNRTNSSIIALIAVAIGMVIFVAYVLSVNLFTVREWLTLPFGKKILRRLNKGSS